MDRVNQQFLFFYFHLRIENVLFASCERHARASASDFAKSCVHYVNTNLPENIRSTVSHRDFMKKFIECFSDHFETEFSRRRIHHKVSLHFDCFRLVFSLFIGLHGSHIVLTFRTDLSKSLTVKKRVCAK